MPEEPVADDAEAYADGPEPITLVVDVANVMGSRPDGWWRDRVGAASRLIMSLGPLVGISVLAAEGAAVRLGAIIAVVEGQARRATGPAEVEIRIAPADGDSTIAAVARELADRGEPALVVTADRGLRERLPAGVAAVGPRWLLAQL